MTQGRRHHAGFAPRARWVVLAVALLAQTFFVSVGEAAAQTPTPDVEPMGLPKISGTVQVGETLTADVGGITDGNGLSNVTFTHQWVRVESNGDEADIDSATMDTYRLVVADLGRTLKVKVSFTDDDGYAEVLTSAATTVVSRARNAEATVLPIISGDAVVGGTLTTVTTVIADGNGLSNVTFTYQWVRVESDGTQADIDGAVAATYRPVVADLGRGLRVRVSFTDDGGNDEALTSAAAGPVTRPNVAPTGLPTVAGTAVVGGRLTASTTGIADGNGLSNVTFTYQWVRVESLGTEADIDSATASTYVPVDDDLGGTLKVRVSFTDDGGNDEKLISAATAAVGAGPAPLVSNVGQRGGTTFPLRVLGGRAQGFTTGASEHGYVLTGVELVVSNVSAPNAVTVRILNRATNGRPGTVLATLINPPLTTSSSGTVAFAAPQGTELVADSTYFVSLSCTAGSNDCIRYWYPLTAGEDNAAGREPDWSILDVLHNGPSWATTTNWDRGELMKIRILGRVKGAPNKSPTGAPTISGTAQVGQKLAVVTTGIADGDGLRRPRWRWQWIRVESDSTEVNIERATASSYTPVAADAGLRLKVKVEFVDDADHVETLTSAASAAVAPARNNAAPTGVLTITGIAAHGHTLTAVTGGIDDPDGLSDRAFGYQWIRVESNGDVADIGSATASTYRAAAADVGRTLKVRVQFTDDGGNVERLTSAASPVVLGVPDRTEPTAVISVSDARLTDSETATVTVTFSEPVFGFVASDLTASSGGVLSGFTGADGDAVYTFTLDKPATGSGTMNLNVAKGVAADGARNTNAAAAQVSVSYSNVENADATGAPTISGTAHVGETLTAAPGSIADANGITGTPYSYQWVRVESDSTEADIDGATGTSYKPVVADVGRTLKVRASFDDDDGYSEARTSAATPVVARAPNTPATGVPTVTGFAEVRYTLTADPSAIADTNGISGATFSYQWRQVDGEGAETDIDAATEATYTPAADDVGKTLKVQVSFTDDGGNDEVRTSAATAAVTAAQPTLVSNIGQADYQTPPVFRNTWLAQEFTTGAHENGYSLLGIDIDVRTVGVDTSTLTVRVHPKKADGAPGPKLHELVVPAQIAPPTLTASAPFEDVVLDPRTSYFVLVECGSGSGFANACLGARSTQASAEDAVSAAGWSIADRRHYTTDGGTVWRNNLVGALQMRIRGTAHTPDTTSPTAAISVSDATLRGSETATVTVTFSEPVSGFAANELTATSGGVLSGFTGADGDAVYTSTLAIPATGSGTINLNVAAGVADDSAGNGNTAASQVAVSYDNTSVVSVTPAAMTVSESGGTAGTGTFNVKLTGNPGGTVTVDLSSSDTAAATVSPAQMTFTGQNWNIAQTATVTGQRDGKVNLNGLRTAQIRISATSAVAAFNQPTARDRVRVAVTDGIDIAGAAAVNFPENSTAAVGTYSSTLPPIAQGQTVTWSLSGADASLFGISTSGVLSFAATPNFEVLADANGDGDYEVTVHAVAGSVRGSLAVTVTVTDVAEPPQAPAAPTVSAKATTTDTLSVTWAAPTNTGRPDISGYEVEYKPSTASPSGFRSHAHSGVATSTEIGSLTGGRAYDVRVRAVNAEGSGDWSDHVTAFTNTPVPATQALVSNVGQTTRAGAPAPVGTTLQSTGFTTGSSPTGYTLASVELDVAAASHTDGARVRVSVLPAIGSVPYEGGTAITLTVPTLSSTTSGPQTFAAPAGTMLDPYTTYFVVVSCTAGGNCLSVNRTAASAEDTGAAPGWSIADQHLQATPAKWLPSAGPLKIRVNGAAVPPPVLRVRSEAGTTDVTLRLGNYDGPWHYLRALPTEGTCTGPRNGVTADVSGLTAGTSYEFGAYSDSACTLLLASATFVATASANNAATGAPTITGTAHVDGTLTADTSGIDDADGLTAPVAYTYQWVRVESAESAAGGQADAATGTVGASGEADIEGANARTYTPTSDDEGKTLGVRVTFADDAGNNEWLASAPTGAVAAAPDTTSPTAVISVSDATLTGSETATVTVTFSEPVNGFEADELTATSGGVLSGFSGADGDTVYTFSLAKPATGMGTINLNVAADAAEDLAGNGNTAASQLAVSYDNASVVSLSATELTVSEAGGTALLDVQLTADPGGTVTVDITSSDTTAVTVVPFRLTFTASNWNSARAVTVTGQRDSAANAGGERAAQIRVSTSSAVLAFHQPAVRDRVAVTVTDVFPPSAPAAPTVSAKTGTTDTLSVTWAAPTNAGRPALSGYEVEYKPSTTPPSRFRSHAHSGTTTSTDIGSLAAGTAYDVRVRAVNAEGSSDWSSHVTAFTNAPDPVPPPELRVRSEAGTTDVTLRLAYHAGPWHYLRTVPAGGTCTGPQTGVTAAVSGLTAGTAYEFGAYSDSACTMLLASATFVATASANNAATGRPAITGTVSVGRTLTAATSGIADADGVTEASYDYQWIRLSGPGAAVTGGASGAVSQLGDIEGASGRTYTPVDADQGFTLKVRVSFNDDSGNAERLISASTAAVAVRQVSGVTVTGARDGLDVSWGAVTGADGYRVQWKSGDESYGAADRELTASGTSLTIPDLAQGTEYTVRVAATVEGASDGEWSDDATGVPIWTAVLTVGTSSQGRGFNTAGTPAIGSLAPATLSYKGAAVQINALFYSAADGAFSLSAQGAVTDSFQLCLDGSSVKSGTFLRGDSNGRTEFSASGLSWSAGDTVDVALVAAAESCPTASVTTTLSGPARFGEQVSGFSVGVRFGELVSGMTADDFVVSGATAGTLTANGMSAYVLALTPTGTDDITVTLPLGAARSATGAYTASSVLTVQSNTAPVFTDGTTATRSVAESVGSTAGGVREVGMPVAATDADADDTLTYTVTSTGAELTAFNGSFTLDASSGQIETKSDAVLDFESATKTWTVTLQVSDSYGGTDSIDVTINLTDATEVPLAPGAPSVSPKASTTDTLLVSWSAPANTGRPGITGYRIRYKPASAPASEYASHTHNGAGTSTEISSLDAGTDYDVQVLAVNGDGDGPWSDAGTGPTGVPAVRVLVSNFGQGSRGGGLRAESGSRFAVAFTTGPNPAGYFLTGVTLDVIAESYTTTNGPLLQVAAATPGRPRPGASLAVLTNPTLSATSAGAQVFTAPGGLSLEANTTYFVVITCAASFSGTSCLHYADLMENAFAEDAGGAEGFAIGDETLHVVINRWTRLSAIPIKIRIRGAGKQAKATGMPAISGTPHVGQMLSASEGTIADSNGLSSPVAYTYEWIRVEADSSEAGIDGAVSSAYTPTSADIGRTLKVRLSFTDDDGYSEQRTSAATAAVAPGQVQNLSVVGAVEGLDVSWDAVAGADGYVVQWKSGNEAYGGAARQATVASGTSHTIGGLVQGTEYTVRVAATKEGTPDGMWSADVSGIPIWTAVLTVAATGAGVPVLGFRKIAQSAEGSLAPATLSYDGGTHEITQISYQRPGSGGIFALVAQGAVTDTLRLCLGGSVAASGVLLHGDPAGTFRFPASGLSWSAGDVVDVALVALGESCPAASVTTTLSGPDGIDSLSSFDVSVAFGADVAGLTASDFVVSGATAVLTANSARSYTLAVTPTDDVTIALPLGAARSEAGAYTASKLLSVPLNRAPTFTEGATATRSIAEDTGGTAGSVGTVGSPVAATDLDGDTLTYSVTGGTDQAAFNQSFTLNASTGQISRKAVLLSHETKSSWSVTLQAADPSGDTDTIDVTVSLTDVVEVPVAPTALSVSAKAGTSNTLSVGWTAPVNTGRPGLSSYDVVWKVATADDSSYSDTGVTHTGTAVTAEIGDLTAGTEYSVRVRAVNDEGDGAWATATGSTAPPDTTRPTAAITVNDASLTGSETATVTVTFSEPVDGFADGDLTTSAGSLSRLTGNVSTLGAVHTFELTPPSAGMGTINLSVAAGVAADEADNTNTAAAQVAVAYDNAHVVAVNPATVTVAENGGTATFGVTLTGNPGGTVTVTVASRDSTAATVDVDPDTTGPQSQLTFNASNWSSAQTVTVTGVDDAIVNPGGNRTVQVQLSAASTIDAFNQPTGRDRVAVTVTDHPALETETLVSNLNQLAMGGGPARAGSRTRRRSPPARTRPATPWRA